jgi:hypothetical protein
MRRCPPCSRIPNIAYAGSEYEETLAASTLDAPVHPHDHPLGTVVMMMRHLLSGALAAALACGPAQAQTAPPAPAARN